jgi:endonuclease/exonuclease/phosphatase (EEP) superfamily protein YafD
MVMNTFIPLLLTFGLFYTAPIVPVSGSQGAAVAPDTLSGTLRVLTYNVAGLPPGISKSQPLQNLPRIGARLDEWDLVLLQEHFFLHDLLSSETNLPHRSEPQRQSRVLSMDFLRSVGRQSVDDLLATIATDRISTDGLNRFSALAFEGFERYPWSSCSGLTSRANDCLASKGFTVARHALAPRAFLDVYNVHGDAGRHPEDERARRAQFRELADFISRYSAGRAVLVAGDTNLQAPVEADEETLTEFMAMTGTRIVARVLDEPDDVDRFFFRSGDDIVFEVVNSRVVTEFRDEDGAPLSDHEAISATFRWALRDSAQTLR